MLVVTNTSRPWTSKGARTASSSFCAMRAASAALWIPGSSSVNSSPPRRARVSPSRTASCTRLPMARSRSSPTECPSESLMCLKRSRSRNSTASFFASRWAWTRARVRRSMNSSRLGSAVSPS